METFVPKCSCPRLKQKNSSQTRNSRKLGCWGQPSLVTTNSSPSCLLFTVKNHFEKCVFTNKERQLFSCLTVLGPSRLVGHTYQCTLVLHISWSNAWGKVGCPWSPCPCQLKKVHFNFKGERLRQGSCSTEWKRLTACLVRDHFNLPSRQIYDSPH